ncbi:hypothetical protein BJ508DRAFT_359329 [Ascobolus immersus RN42]|uniref:Uncharacterized protein n=1 Tax=Ascobolus immersus RN42 TaxID=1160509 RepID=A0A3N4ILD4_ASCIM|nr:hypothetical protein BJ508DRAFT_359329 [Ascobolus immersus RN42]
MKLMKPARSVSTTSASLCNQKSSIATRSLSQEKRHSRSKSVAAEGSRSSRPSQDLDNDSAVESTDDSIASLKPRDHVLRKLSARIEHVADEISEHIDRATYVLDSAIAYKQYQIKEVIGKVQSTVEGKGKAKEPIKKHFKILPRPFWLRYVPVKQGDSIELMVELAIDERLAKGFDEDLVMKIKEGGEKIVREREFCKDKDQQRIEELVDSMNNSLYTCQAARYRRRKEESELKQIGNSHRPVGYYEQLDLLRKRIRDPRARQEGIYSGVMPLSYLEPLTYYTGYRTYGRSSPSCFPILYGMPSRYGPPPPMPWEGEDLRKSPKRFWREYERRTGPPAWVDTLSSMGQKFRDTTTRVVESMSNTMLPT